MTGRWLNSLMAGIEAQIESVPRIGLKGPDAPLAEYNVGVAFTEDILRAIEPLLNGGVHAPLQQDGPLRPSYFLEEREVLHVPCADLQDVGILAHPEYVARVDYFRHDRQTRLFLCLLENLKSLETESLECVW